MRSVQTVQFLKLFINTFKESNVQISAGSLFQTLILLKFIDISDFFMLQFGSMRDYYFYYF